MTPAQQAFALWERIACASTDRDCSDWIEEELRAARKAALLEAADVIRSQKTAPDVRWTDMAGVFGGPGAIDGWKGACNTGEHLLRRRAEEEKP